MRRLSHTNFEFQVWSSKNRSVVGFARIDLAGPGFHPTLKLHPEISTSLARIRQLITRPRQADFPTAAPAAAPATGAEDRSAR